jgi:hypothetical protein
MNISKAVLDGTFCPVQIRYCFHSGAGHQQRAQATTDFGQQGNLTGQSQGTLGQFEGPVNQSPFYKSLLTTGIQDTSNAYQNARSSMRQNANAAGFGYAQPAAQGADNQLQAQEASALASVPQQAMLGAAPLSLQAAGQTGNMGMSAGQQGAGLLNANAQNTSGLYNNLLTAAIQGGAGAGAAFCPAKGSLYLMADGTEKLVEALQVGEQLQGIDGEAQTIEEIQTAKTPVLRIETEDGFVTRNSRVHAFALPAGGFVVAMYALGKTIRTAKGVSKVISVKWNGDDEVFNVITDGSHTYRADGVWALGVGEAERHVSMERWREIGNRLEATA